MRAAWWVGALPAWEYYLLDEQPLVNAGHLTALPDHTQLQEHPKEAPKMPQACI
jgi:hypothetical protein